MARISQKMKVKAWQRRVQESNRANENWRKDFRVDDLEDIYAGPGQEDPENGDKYVINKIFPTIEIGIPSLLFYHPQVKIRPRLTRIDDVMSRADDRAKLQEDTVNTFITDPALNFKPITTLSLKESFFVFGVVEVGYTADLIDNPLLHKPELTEDEMAFAGLEKIPNFNSDQPEKLYMKRIPAKQFRVPANSSNILEHNDWVGYYEWQRTEDIKANPKYGNTSQLRISGRQARDVSEPDDDDNKDVEGHGHRDMVKVWKIWDLRTMRKHVFPDVGDKFFIEAESFEFLPLADYRPYQLMDTFYPVPPVYNWLYPQEEMNDIRNKRRIHRRRFNRRYLYDSNRIDPVELEKLESDEDGVYADAAGGVDAALKPVEDAPLDPGLFRDEMVTETDFREISGIGSEDRGEAQTGTTATQANIVELNKRIRESYRRQMVGEWLAKIATIMLKLIRTKMALPFWIKRNVDPVGPAAGMEALKVADTWMKIMATDLEDLQLDISVDIQSLSPMSEEGERINWMQILAMLANPALLSVLLGSDLLLKKTLSFYGMRSQAEINEFRKAGQNMMAMLMASAVAQSGGGKGSAPGQSAAPGPTPSNGDIRGQLTAQMGVA